MSTSDPAYAAYADLVRELAPREPASGWSAGRIPALTDKQLAIVLRAFPKLHDEALSDMEPKAGDVIDALAVDPIAGAMSAWQLVGTAYRVQLVKYIRNQLAEDLEFFSEERGLAREARECEEASRAQWDWEERAELHFASIRELL